MSLVKIGSDLITNVSTHVTHDEQLRRLSICSGCMWRVQFAQDMNGRCSVCSCPLTNKTAVDKIGGVKPNSCPKGKW